MKIRPTALALLISGTVSLHAGPPVPEDSQLTVEGRVAFTEGPAWHPSGNVYFSDIANNRIMRRDRTGAIHVYRTPSGRTNGLAFDHDGRLICCEGGGAESNRRVTRIELDGTITVLAETIAGKRFNSPNDCTIDSKGRIYFTDPRYRDRRTMEILDDDGRKIEGVYRIDGPDQIARILTHEVDRPNGIAISPDENYLFVADHVNGESTEAQNRKLWRFNFKSDGTVEPESRKLLFDWGSDRGPDGMAIDSEGRLYVTAGSNFPTGSEPIKKYKSGIYVIDPEDGTLLQFIAVPMDMITNCTFGGEDLKTLFITAGHKLWSIQASTPGHVAWLQPKAAPVAFKTTASGLKYRILRASDGRRPVATDRVKCHYRGWLDDGTEFDSSYKRGQPATFPLSAVITGWTEGLQLVGEGGKIELEIPHDLGYGERGVPPKIPARATLHFEVELIAIE